MYRFPITIDKTKVKGTNTNFVYLFSELCSSIPSGFWSHVVDTVSGLDIRFFDTDGLTELKREIVFFDVGGHKIESWVLVPSLNDASDKVIYCQYGVLTKANDYDLWTIIGAVAVYHFQGTSDSTPNANNGTNHGVNFQAGKIGNCANFDRVDSDWIDVPNAPSLLCHTWNYGITAWVKNKVGSLAGGNTYAQMWSDPVSMMNFVVYGDPTWAHILLMMTDTGSFKWGGHFDSLKPLTEDVWHHLTEAKADALVRLLIDGEPKNTNLDYVGVPFPTNLNLEIGRSRAPTYMDGMIDELRIYSDGTIPTADWTNTEYNNQNDPATFSYCGPEEHEDIRILSAGGAFNLGPYGAHRRIMVSDDNGVTWSTIYIDDIDDKFVSITKGDGQIVLALTVSGKIFRSTDNGISWTDLGDVTGPCMPFFLSNNPTGQVKHLSGSTFLAGGTHLYRTTNNGDTWTQINFTIPVGLDLLPGMYIGAIKKLDNGDILITSDIDPFSQYTPKMYCLKSVDNGLTFSHIPLLDTTFTYRLLLNITDLGSGRILIAGPVFDIGDPNFYASVYLTTDYGSTWNRVCKELDTLPPGSAFTDIVNIGSGTLFAVGFKKYYFGSNYFLVEVSHDNGSTWLKVSGYNNGKIICASYIPSIGLTFVGIGDYSTLGYLAESADLEDGYSWIGLTPTDKPERTNSIIFFTPTFPSLIADFIGTPLSGYSPLTVQFTDTSTGSPSTWDWDFGDGSVSTEQNPSHVYTVAGVYTVTLSVNGGASTKTRTDYITVNIAADFTGFPIEGEAPLSVVFTDTSTGSPDTWLWEFGDGTTSTSHNPTHIYTTSGAYTIKLTASKGAISDIKIKTEYIIVLVNYPTLVTEDYAVSPERLDVRTMHASSVGNYLFIKKGIRIILKSQDTGDSGFIRPNGPTVVFD